MPIVTLRDLYVDELQDLLDAEQQILSELPSMAAAATSSALREAFDEHLEQTRIHAERVELLLRKLGAQGGRPCEAVRGLIAESRRRIADTERGDVLDAALIGAAQRIEHYEIAAYGCARTYARTLDDGEAARILQQTLDEEGAADARLTRIAERGVNDAAGEDLQPDADRQRERLRYVPASELREFKYREFRVRNTDGEDLGSLDGLIVDQRSHRPQYFVIDSGGWFMGQRYIVPIEALTPEDTARTLHTDLTRSAIESYPPFTPDAYLPLRAAGADAAGADVAGVEEYRPPTWLMTGVWMTDASGFAAVPPRAQSDLAGPADPPDSSSYPERERMVARGDSDDRDAAAPDTRDRSRRSEER